MIISRAPYRISLFGGGSDYPEWFVDNGGKVLSIAIDKYCYITLTKNCLHDIPYKVVWRHVELCESPRDILHPAVREAFKIIDVGPYVEIRYHGELPARSGMGSSSSFAVALLNAMTVYKQGAPVSKEALLANAIMLEREFIGDTVGWQDQAAAVYGGAHIYEFGPGEKMEVLDLNLYAKISDLINNLFLVYTHTQRTSSFIAKDIVSDIKKKDVGKLVEMVDEAYYALVLSRLDDIGHLLHKSWQIKKTFSPMISSVSSGLDYVYDEAIKGGALGGKALGVGGGGFMVFYVPWEAQEKFIATMKPISTIVPFSLSDSGAEIIPT